MAGSEERAEASLLLVVGAWFLLTLLAGQFTATDEIAFKAAGREWAKSGRFSAPELAGFGDFEPPVEKIWFAHLPLYTFAFGLFVKVFGFGSVQSVAFDALIHSQFALLTYALCRAMSPRTSPFVAVVAAALVLPVATVGRADELAICFAIGAIVLLTKGITLGRLLVAGVLLGMSMATSGVATILLGIHAVIVICAQRRSFKTSARDLALVAVVGMASALACVAPILIAHPDSINQFRSHASRQFATSLSWGIAFSWTYGKRYLMPAFAGVLVAFDAVLVTHGRREVLARFGGATIAVVLVLFLLPAKAYYLLFVIPILAAAACATIAEAHHKRRLATVIALAIYLGGIATPIRQMFIHATLDGSQLLAPNVATIRRIVPRGSVVLASEFWSEIANDYDYRSLVHGEPELMNIDYVILTGNGTGMPGRPQTGTPEQQATILKRFEVVHDNLPREVPRLFGVPLSSSGAGYGTLILRRREEAEANALR